VESRAKPEGLDVDSQVMEHVQVIKAPKTGHRTYRDQSWINLDMSSLCYTETLLNEKEQTAPQPEEEVAWKKSCPKETE
jgi:hypothetical protein